MRVHIAAPYLFCCLCMCISIMTLEPLISNNYSACASLSYFTPSGIVFYAKCQNILTGHTSHSPQVRFFFQTIDEDSGMNQNSVLENLSNCLNRTPYQRSHLRAFFGLHLCSVKSMRVNANVFV